MVDRAMLVLGAAVAIQMMFGFSGWGPTTPTGVRRDDLEAEMRLAETALEMASVAEASVRLAPIDPLLAAAVRNLQLRMKLVSQMLDGYDLRPWFQKAWIDATSMRGHTEWFRQWREEWAKALREEANTASSNGGDDVSSCSADDDSCPASSGGAKMSAPPSTADVAPRQQRRPKPRPTSSPPPRLSEAAKISDIEPTLDEILRLMDAQPTVKLAQERGCEALRYIATDDETREVIARKRGVEIVIAGMRVNEGHADVLGYCAGTLTHFAATPSLRSKILSLQGVEIVLKAMADHLDSEFVQYKGCAALANVAASATEQAKVVELGGIEVILKGMDRQMARDIVQGHCVGALYNLASSSEHRARMSESKAQKILRRAMTTHPLASDLQRVGKDLLNMLGQ